MNIAIVVPIVGNFGRKGFYHSQEIGLGKEIAKRGHKVTVYKCVPLRSMEKITVERHECITVKYIPTLSIGPHGLFKSSIIEKDSEILFVFSDTQLVIPSLYNYCKKNSIKFIPYVGIAHSFQKSIKSKIIDWIFRLTTLKVYRKETVIAKTEDAKQELISMGIEKCIVAPVGLDFESLKVNFEEYDRIGLRKKWGFSENDIIISFVARLQAEKRPIELIDIFKKMNLPNKKLVIIGDGPLKKDINEKIFSEELEDKVVIIPQVKYNEMWELHYIADYFLNLRDDEIFGMAIMEAVYYKSCVIAISAPGPDTILKGMKSHVICESFSEINDMINIKRINTKSISEDQLRLKENFGWDKCVEAIIDINNNII